MRRRTRIAAATAAVALLTGGTVAAAEAATSPSPSPTASSSASASASVPGDAAAKKAKAAQQELNFDQLAAKLRVTPAQLDRALADAKQSMGTRGLTKPDAVVYALVAKDLGISEGQARALVEHVFGGDQVGKQGPGGKLPGVKPGAPDPQIVAALAKVLGVSDAKAAAVLDQLDAVWRTSGRAESTDPAFRAIAASLGLTPDRLAQDLVQMKESLRASMPSPSGSLSPSDAPSDAPSGAPSGKG
ncbi:hypothetical protein ABIA32_003714 [Streptacidiphilus sp. MAP12-20]|uniref:hypothetical protein n=1 Tax=Streptacidiphilus sp. MAP12-20 TaxID=3156299 RepID=UPI00351715E5